MKTLAKHQILFDAECPMCNLYTGAFVRYGLLEVNGRESYQHYAGQACPNLDWQRAVNEIALVNQETGEVTYGVESLLKVCGNACPPLEKLFRLSALIWFAKKAYSFISYNRRVIVPASEQNFRFQPTFRLNYRMAWLLFCWVATSLILTNYAQLLVSTIPPTTFGREFAICFGQIVFQGLIIHFYCKEKTWEYLGNMMTISLAGALLLLTVMIIGNLVHLSAAIYTAIFLIIVGLMLIEHIRRSKLLGIGLPMTMTWMLYRILVLTFILWL